MINLKNKTALITGASSGIGRSTALLMAQLGANLVPGVRRAALLDTLVSEIQTIGGQAVALNGDVCNELYSKQLVELAQTKYGQLDNAFNNASILGEMGNNEIISNRGWNDTLQTDRIPVSNPGFNSTAQILSTIPDNIYSIVNECYTMLAQRDFYR
ncbi:MAG: SDR family NAD(P)-dependent oxidoreductase [Cohaesibacteraceae bacterium]|nr:SDR family NAD(P)-dependent oxidoreductase [Cohaesibacteraceae bacterium]MBL4875244.1 SDR family NAD(P)-dependent oxidoreductase [Cohaesibacteraceae bacterium]